MQDTPERRLALALEISETLDARIRELESEVTTLIYWLLRAYESGHRQGWEEGPSTAETMDGIHSVLYNRGYDPDLHVAAKELLQTEPKF